MTSLVFAVAAFIAVVQFAARVGSNAKPVNRTHVRRRTLPARSNRAERLEVLERSAADATTSEAGYRQGLRTQLRFVVIDRLRRKGIDLDTDPRAEELLGTAAWSLLCSDPTSAAHSEAAGLTDHEVRALTEMLERIR